MLEGRGVIPPHHLTRSEGTAHNPSINRLFVKFCDNKSEFLSSQVPRFVSGKTRYKIREYVCMYVWIYVCTRWDLLSIRVNILSMLMGGR